MNEILKNKTDNLPEKSGVYMMLDENGEIIYVGKAKNLKNRVMSYFRKNVSHTTKVIHMVANIRDINYVITDSEAEALLLECNLIKTHKPYYNILLKDDKAYPYIMLTLSEEYPRVLFSRTRKNDKNKYFGPYPDSSAVKATIDAINDVYPIQMCGKKTSYGTTQGRVCLNYHIHKCLGCCTGEVDREEYLGYIRQIEEILSGKHKILTDRLREMMLEESKKLNFELAGEIKKKIDEINSLFTKQMISATSFDERDIIGIHTENGQAYVHMFIVRDGRIIRTVTKKLSCRDEELSEVLESFIMQYYTTVMYIPSEIVLQCHVPDEEVLGELLSEVRGKKVKFTVPRRGEKKRLMELSVNNARLSAEVVRTKKENSQRKKDEALMEISRIAGIARPAVRIESYDISHISGSDAVGVMVVYTDGKKDPSQLRKFRIKYAEGGDEYASMSEVIFRRLTRAKEETEENAENPKFLPLPDVIMLDGGKVHVKIIKGILEDFGFSDVGIIGLVKNSHHRLRGIIDGDGNEHSLSEMTSSRDILMGISEYVHEKAVGYHRNTRSKRLTSSELDDIPGIGKERKNALLRYFGSIEEIKNADISELKKAEKMNEASARSVYEYFRKEDAADTDEGIYDIK